MEEWEGHKSPIVAVPFFLRSFELLHHLRCRFLLGSGCVLKRAGGSDRWIVCPTTSLFIEGSFRVFMLLISSYQRTRRRMIWPMHPMTPP